MRNQSPNFIPIPTRPAKSTPKPSSMRPPVHRKSSSCQTDRLVLLKEENIHLNPCPRQNDGGMRRDYLKAVNYINSCHKFLNAIIEKNSEGQKYFLLPMVTNFVPLFGYLTQHQHLNEASKTVARKREEDSGVNYVPRVASRGVKCKSASPGRGENNGLGEERKKRSQFGMKKVASDKPDNVAVGDCRASSARSLKGRKAVPAEKSESKIGEQVADLLKGQVNNFLTSLQVDIHKATQQIINDASTTEEKCRNLEVISQRLEDLSAICHKTAVKQSPRKFEEIFIVSEGLEDVDDKEEVQVLAYTSVTSLDSESSSIKSDTDVEK